MVKLTGICHAYDGKTVLENQNLTVLPGQRIALMGPSGVGKTTLLRTVLGLLKPDSGTLENSFRTAAVFQEPRLLPWRTAAENVNLVLSDKAATMETAKHWLAKLGLEDAGDKYPEELSGGMQQRVAIARALASQPKLLVMDEPYASVDAQTRADLEDLLLRIQRQLGITVLVVTHDIDESVYLADHIIVLSTPPSVVAETIEVDLPHPRDQVTTKTDPRFVEIRGHVAQLLRHRELQVVEKAS